MFENCALLGTYAASSGGLLKMGPIGCPETSVRNCHYSLRKSPEERNSHVLRGGNVKSRRYLLAEMSIFPQTPLKALQCRPFPKAADLFVVLT